MMRLENVSKSFNGKTVLDSLSLEIQDGRTTVISGASGRGKTTLLNLLMGLKMPDSGVISGVPEHIAAVFQEDRLPQEFSPAVCVLMTAAKGVTREEARRHLSELGLAGHLDKPVRELSGGMRRRTAVARAVLARSEAIFMDEPFTGLDAETRLRTIDYIKKYTAGKTLVVVSHSPEDAELLEADRLSL